MQTSTTSVPASNVAEDQALIIGKGFTIEGQIQGSGLMLIHGTVKGGISADVVKLTATALVMGHVDCRQLDIEGRLNGSFEAVDVVVRNKGEVLIHEQAISTGTCLVAGVVSGQLTATQLKVETTGRMSGPITTKQLDVHGSMQGEIHVADMVVRSSGVVTGKVHYGNLSMERGSDVSGQLQRDTQSGATKPTAPAHAAEQDKVIVYLPVTIMQQLIKHPGQLKLSLANGEKVPSWISVDLKHSWLVLEKTPFEQLAANGQTVTLRLQAGSEDMTFTLPPEAE
jgi:cytoskeletal protein CcmA (bactofilin family)